MAIKTKVILILSIILTVAVLTGCIIGYYFFRDMFAKIFGAVIGTGSIIAVAIVQQIQKSKEKRKKRHEEINNFDHNTFDPANDPFHNRDKNK